MYFGFRTKLGHFVMLKLFKLTLRRELVFMLKDMAYSKREVVVKTNRTAL